MESSSKGTQPQINTYHLSDSQRIPSTASRQLFSDQLLISPQSKKQKKSFPWSDKIKELSYNIKYKYSGKSFSLDPSSHSRGVEGESNRTMIVYLLHEKFVLRDRLSKKDRKRIEMKLQDAFQTVTWITYRSELELKLSNSNYTSDAGWGCMLRTGQMLLFQGLQRHLMGENFKHLHLEWSEEVRRRYSKLLRLQDIPEFIDNNCGNQSPFSIHNIAKEGLKMGRKPGDWYGPQAISIVLKELNKNYKPLSDFEMIVCNDGNIYFDKIDKKSKQWTHSVFVVVPLRLGLHQIQPEYLKCLKTIFQFPSNQGIAGGRDKFALYFVGLSDNDLIYLDPHYVRKAISSNDLQRSSLREYYDQYHCRKMKKLNINSMCTSIAVGFYLRDQDEFLEFKLKMSALSKTDNCIFSVYETKPLYMREQPNHQEDNQNDEIEDDFVVV